MFHVKPDVQTLIRKNGIQIESSQFKQLETYVDILLDWNRKINLISRKDEEKIWTNHILLSLSFCFQFDFLKRRRILDIGTGGGLPGIPLSILYPNTDFFLVDSIRKKTQAVKSMINALGLKNVNIAWARAEELRASARFRPFDSVIARSVSTTTNLTSWSLPLLRSVATEALVPRSGKLSLPAPALISLKGGDITGEISEAKRVHPDAAFEVIDLSFAGQEFLLNQDKKFVVVRKKPF
jgi:16S rRNA (guanine527-N7)-methyltransferase